MRLTAKLKTERLFQNSYRRSLFSLLPCGGDVASLLCKMSFTRVAGREADLTLGDAWKAVTLQQDWNDNSGISNMIVYSEKKEAVDAAPRIWNCTRANLQMSIRVSASSRTCPSRRAEFFEAFRKHGIEYAASKLFRSASASPPSENQIEKNPERGSSEAEKKSEQGAANDSSKKKRVDVFMFVDAARDGKL